MSLISTDGAIKYCVRVYQCHPRLFNLRVFLIRMCLIEAATFATATVLQKCKSRGVVMLFLRFEAVWVSTFVRNPWGPLGWVQKSVSFAVGVLV